MKNKQIEISQEIFKRIEAHQQNGESVENVLERLVPVQDNVVDVRMKKSSHQSLIQFRINNENIDSVIERLTQPAPVPVEHVFSSDVLLRFKTFSNPSETPDQTLLRLIKVAATNSIDDNIKERLLKIGRGGEHLSDIIENLIDFYMDGTLNTTIRTFVSERKKWDLVRNQRESRRYLGHRWDRGGTEGQPMESEEKK